MPFDRDTLQYEMATNVLVVTPSPSFGELTRRDLEETGQYRVYIVNTKASAIVRADEESCGMAFLDFDMGETWVEDVGRSLRTILPNIQLFVLAQNEPPPPMDSIRPWTLVQKPLQIPELLKSLKVSTPAQSSEPKTEDAASDLPWLNDVSKAAQHLTRLTLESSSQAALITRQNELWAYAGGLSQAAANEVAQSVSRNWSAQKGSDLLRFIRLESTKAEHMLYATQLSEGMLLAMVFDAETPFSTIRMQASQLATALNDDGKSEPSEAPKNSNPDATLPLNDEGEEEGIEIPPIGQILVDIPLPNPKPTAPLPAQNTVPPAPAREAKRPLDPGQTRPSIFSRESSPPIPIKDLLIANQQPVNLTETLQPQSRSSMDELDLTAPSKSQPRPETPVRRPGPGELDETLPHSVSEAAGRVLLEPTTASLYNLTYACLLVPRFTSHYLTGDIADQLSAWLPQICIAFGWRLEYVAVRPEYLQWVVNVPPATSPGYLMRVMRQQTSEKVFSETPRLKKENPSGDFWAPGYLIMGGNQPHPPQLVKDYIKQIRQRQGIEKSHK